MEQENTLYLAPMEGLTTYVYRNAFQKYYGGIDTYFSPFLANTKMSNKERNDICPEHNPSLSLIPQVLTNRSDVFLSLAKQLSDYGYTCVNLNLGCPSGTVVAKHRGAGFLESTALLQQFFDEVFNHCPLKISIKTRIGINSTEEWSSLTDTFAQYPFSEIIIHPRLQKEFYNGSVHIDAFIASEQKLAAPICYNGNITSEDSLQELQNQGVKTHTFMLGRGVLSDPTLPQTIKKSLPTADNLKSPFLIFMTKF